MHIKFPRAASVNRTYGNHRGKAKIVQYN
jgi:hypothetical protein